MHILRKIWQIPWTKKKKIQQIYAGKINNNLARQRKYTEREIGEPLYDRFTRKMEGELQEEENTWKW